MGHHHPYTCVYMQWWTLVKTLHWPKNNISGQQQIFGGPKNDILACLCIQCLCIWPMEESLNHVNRWLNDIIGFRYQFAPMAASTLNNNIIILKIVGIMLSLNSTCTHGEFKDNPTPKYQCYQLGKMLYRLITGRGGARHHGSYCRISYSPLGSRILLICGSYWILPINGKMVKKCVPVNKCQV